MSISSKSPRKVAMAALAVGKDVLPDRWNKYAPKTFTPAQFFAILVLKRFEGDGFRDIEQRLHDMPTLCNALGLKRAPVFSAIEKAQKRLLNSVCAKQLLNTSVQLSMQRRKNIRFVAADSTGMQAGHVSTYFICRRSRVATLWQTTTYRRFSKLSAMCDTKTHLIVSMHAGRGPRPDVNELATLLDNVVPCVDVHHLLADAGYDSEFNHRYAREYHGVKTTIPPKIGRPTKKPPKGRYRRLMKQTIESRDYYGQRWQVETVYSMIKRNQGDEVAARSYHAQNRELRLMALTHNIAILLLREVFYRAGPGPISCGSGPCFRVVGQDLRLALPPPGARKTAAGSCRQSLV